MSLGKIALGAALLGAGAGTAWVLVQPLAPVTVPAPPPAPAPLAAPGPPAAALPSVPSAGAAPAQPPPPAVATLAEAEIPRFDVARVGARGTLVAAGRAAPHAEVVLLDGAIEIGRARADGRGEWVILPAESLPAGARELSLRARRPGGSFVAGRDVVLLVVPESPVAAPSARAEGRMEEVARPAPAPPLAVLLPAQGAGRGTEAPRLLQAPPAPAPSESASPARGGRLGLDIVDYEEGGEIRFAGSAPPGAMVRLYVGRDHLGDAQANSAGRWQLTPEDQPAIGRHTLRVDQLAAAGTVAARIEVPFQRERLPEEVAEGAGPQLVVQPGQSLWRIARRVYGRGTRYTVIYDANRSQIRDPRLIYPGQVFAMPGASAPPASSLSR